MFMITRLGQILQRILTTVVEEAAHRAGWAKRKPRKLSPIPFVQTLVLGWLAKPEATLCELTQTAAALGVQVSAQGLDQRFNPESAQMTQEVLEEAVKEVLGAEPVAMELLSRFEAVYIADSSTVTLPDALAELWPGCGGQSHNSRAALKLFVRLDLLGGAMHGPFLAPGRCTDTRSPLQEMELGPGSLQIEDLGFFSTKHLGKLSGQGVYWLSRLQSQTALYTPQGVRIELFDALPRREAELLELDVLLGAEERVPCRLIAVRVPQEVASERRRRLKAQYIERREALSQRRLALCDWTMLVTNVPSEKLSPKEAMVLLRARWQIERVFLLWKKYGFIDQWRSEKPYRILTELYAKLLGVLLQHWFILTALWGQPARSMIKAAQSIRQYAPLLVVAFGARMPLTEAVRQMCRILEAGCKLDSRNTAPNTYQLIENPNLLHYLQDYDELILKLA